MKAEFSDAALRALRHADQVMREADRSDVFTTYDACRAAVSAIAPLDDFYVGLIHEPNRRISYPYLFSNGSFLEGGTVTYGPRGVVAWVLASARPYAWGQDRGALLNRGVRFGDEHLSADALIVPLRDEHDGVIGVVGVLSDTPNAFAGDALPALEWLAALMTDRLYAARPGRRLNLDLVYPDLHDEGRSGSLTAVNAIASQLSGMAAELDRVGASFSDTAPEHEQILALSRRCFEIQALLVTRLGSAFDEHRSDPLARLSPRERAVVDLVTGPDGDPGNAGIAAALGIGVATVKTHLASALDKVGLRHHSELRWLIGAQGS